jgi:hypothetical protein
MTGPRTLVRAPVRRQTGYDLDLIGYGTEHISFGSEVLFATHIRVRGGWTMRSPWPPCWSVPQAGRAVMGRNPTRWRRGRRTSSSRWPSRNRPTAIPR